MATWPDAEKLKQRLDITSDVWDTDMENQIAAGIEWVKVKVGDWNEDLDEPTEALAQSALERAVEMATSGPAAEAVKSQALLYGRRRRFGIA